MTSTAIQRSRSVMFGCCRARASSASRIALPVASAACAMRRTACPPSRVRCRPSGPEGSAENGTPLSTSHSTACALCSATKRAVCSSTRPAPASRVSCTCDSMLSSSPRTPTMPPCAQAVAPSSRPRLASTMTGWCAARCSAAVSPARPAPTITTGRCACTSIVVIVACRRLSGGAAIGVSEGPILSVGRAPRRQGMRGARLRGENHVLATPDACTRAPRCGPLGPRRAFGLCQSVCHCERHASRAPR